MISTVTTTITAVITAQVMAYSIIAVVFLIIFLALKEILSSETDRPSIKVVPERIKVANHTLTTCFRSYCRLKSSNGAIGGEMK